MLTLFSGHTLGHYKAIRQTEKWKRQSKLFKHMSHPILLVIEQ